MMNPETIRQRHRDAILQSLRAGVVPRVGQQHVQVGRAGEVKALLNDLKNIADGGSAIRFVIGEYGSGKTFFLFLIRSIALEKNLVTANADLNPDRRLFGSGGQARSLYTELMRNISTRSKPDGGALATIVERFVTSALEQAKVRSVKAEVIIQERLASLSELVGGYDFAEVVAAYWRGHDTGNEELKSAALRWLRGEFSTKTEARAAVGVRVIIDDGNVYDSLKLLSRFVRLAGYGGLLVCLDELVNLYKLANSQSRNSNYEQILRILNDSLQGTAVGMGFLLGGTPEFLMDTRRGLFSYEALQSRLADNRYAGVGLIDHSGPVIRLGNLTKEDLYVLLGKIRHVYASGDPAKYLLPDEALQSFMAHCSKKIGDAYFQMPRNTIKSFVGLLSILEQNPQITWQQLLENLDVTADSNPDVASAVAGAEDSPSPQSGDPNDDLADLRI